jgi:hypothetical protein
MMAQMRFLLTTIVQLAELPLIILPSFAMDPPAIATLAKLAWQIGAVLPTTLLTFPVPAQ